MENIKLPKNIFEHAGKDDYGLPDSFSLKEKFSIQSIEEKILENQKRFNELLLTYDEEESPERRDQFEEEMFNLSEMNKELKNKKKFLIDSGENSPREN